MKPNLQLRLPKPQVTNHQAKNKWLVCILFFCISPAFAQDIIYTTKGDQIKCKVEEVGEDSVSFHSGDAAKPLLSALVKKEVFVIKYANGWADTITAVKRATANLKPVEKAVSNTPASSISDATIFTTDGKQIACKVTEIDDTEGISYLTPGNSKVQKIDIKAVMKIKYSNGSEDPFNMPGKKPDTADTKIAKKTADDTTQKDTLASILQNWSRKYIAPPLEIF